jgi:serine/threonine protein phosphatase PrpC
MRLFPDTAYLSEARDHLPNEDYGYCGEIQMSSGMSVLVACVADGVSSLKESGDVARWVAASFVEAIGKSGALSDADLARDLAEWGEGVQKEAFERWGGDGDLKGASTFSGCVLWGQVAVIAHIGDSMIFWADGNSCRKMIRPKQLDLSGDDEARPANVLKEGIAFGPEFKIAVQATSLPGPDGWLLVMSDGVHKLLSGDSVIAVAGTSWSAKDVALSMLKCSFEAGTLLKQNKLLRNFDNASVAVIRHGKANVRKWLRMRLLPAGGLFVAGLLLIIAVKLFKKAVSIDN